MIVYYLLVKCEWCTCFIDFSIFNLLLNIDPISHTFNIFGKINGHQRKYLYRNGEIYCYTLFYTKYIIFVKIIYYLNIYLYFINI